VRRLLVVDDEVDIVDALRELLDLHAPHVAVVAASNGAEALETIARVQVDAVVTDYRMPTMNGEQLVHEIRQRYPGLPVMMLTALAAPQTLHELQRRFPGLEVVIKPLDVDRFVPRLLALVGVDSPSRPAAE
jgi:two-component system response regulator FlrC